MEIREKVQSHRLCGKGTDPHSQVRTLLLWAVTFGTACPSVPKQHGKNKAGLHCLANAFQGWQQRSMGFVLEWLVSMALRHDGGRGKGSVASGWSLLTFQCMCRGKDVHMCVQMCLSVHVGAWRPEVDGVCLPPPLSPFTHFSPTDSHLKGHLYRLRFHCLGRVGCSEQGVSVLPSLV